ncbi:hypothetical protein LPJ78_003871 [Coemansia sp. RSA 989]|nr:hypothetical protein LPJ78_003871 [Coemansia sp. RSA 989]KAJ1871533.1 hypothetical protein LPJ55_003832 [Coemansia sp. RSA 990]KAJ2647019.1 hypothetical protein IWW40_005013 [Coemansia sp. RSA 1250]KAJ2668814.1 hypothetical protein IWW42_004950 [Coemansia sp. RSA 1085]
MSPPKKPAFSLRKWSKANTRRIVGPVHPHDFQHLPPLPPRVTKTYRPNRKPLAEISKKTPELPIPPSSPLQRQLSRSKPVVSLADGFVLELETPSSGEYPALPPDEATNQPFRIAA